MFPMSDANDPIPQLNRGQIARAMGVSVVTIDEWIGKGMPVAEKGSNGRPYKFDLEACQAWKRGEDAKDEQERAQQEALIREQTLQLTGGAAGDSEMAIAPEKRRAFYDAEFAWRREAIARGELMRTADVERQFGEVFKFLAQGLQSLPDVLARKCSLPPEAVTQIQSVVDAWQEDMAKILQHEDELGVAA